MAQQGYGAAAGAAVGSAIMPGVGTAIGALAGSLLDGDMSKGGVGSAQQGGASSAAVAAYGNGLDGSGWNVNFGAGSIRSESTQDKRNTGDLTPTATATTPGAPGGMFAGSPLMAGGGFLSGVGIAGVPNYVWLAVGGMVLWKLSRKRRA